MAGIPIQIPEPTEAEVNAALDWLRSQRSDDNAAHVMALSRIVVLWVQARNASIIAGKGGQNAG